MYNLGLVYGKELALYSFGPSHPFRAERLQAFWELASQLKSPKLKLIEPVLATEEEILLFHTKEYVDFVKAASKTGVGLLDYGDTPSFKGVYEASCWYVGSVLRCLELLLNKEVKTAFCPIAGLHHARRDGAAGFCVFNDAGIAIEVAKKKGIKRILYVDIDAHHGDGVFYAFESDPDVWIADIHQSPLYPGTGSIDETGKGKAKGTKLNLPLAPGSGDEEFKLAFEKIIEFANKAKPELIILNCGGDGMAGDPITQLEYENAHEYAAEKLKEIADKFCQGKILAVGGGGYNLKQNAKAWTSICKVFLR